MCHVTFCLTLEYLLAIDHAVHDDEDCASEEHTEAHREEDKATFAYVEVVYLDFWLR